MPPLPFFPNEASTLSGQTDLLFLFMLLVSVVVIIGIGGAILLFVVRYHRRSEDEIPEQIVGSTRLELAWTLIPLGLTMIPFVWGASIYLQSSQPPANSEQVYVVAKQWMWKFQHADGQSEINELHVPVGRPIKLSMTAQDVIHSFFVPDFRVKQDVLPDRYTTIWFQANQTGRFRIFCTQYCGTNHSQMTGFVVVMTPSDYATWLAGGTTQQSPAQAGASLFQQYGCSGCHHADGSGPGPSLVGVFGHTVHLNDGSTLIADESYVRESILNPTAKIVEGYQPIMPSFQGRLSEEQILQLIAYIQSLGSQTGSGVQPPSTNSTSVPGATPNVVSTVTPPAATPAPLPFGATETPGSFPTGTVPVSPTTPGAATTATGATPTQEPARPSNPGRPGAALNLKGDPANGAKVFAANCAACHGPQGTTGIANPGSTDGTVPPLNPIDPTIASRDPKVFAYNVDLFVEHGSTPDGPNPGVVMPAWGDKKLLTPQQIADVIAYIISLNPNQP